MIGPVISMSAFYGISRSSRLSVHLTRFHSVVSSSQRFHLRSLPELSFGECQLPALKFKFSHGRSNYIQCYCTNTKKSNHLQSADILKTTKFTNTKKKQVMDCNKEIVLDNDTALHDCEQIDKSCLSGSDTVNHKWECLNEDDEPIDHRALIELEVEMLRQEGHDVPDKVSSRQWEELLSLPYRNARKKYLRFLFVSQIKNENNKEKKELKRIESEKKYIDRSQNLQSEDGHIQYGLWNNTIFLRIRDATINHFKNSRVISALMHGQHLVFDLDFDKHMTMKERRSCVRQLHHSIGSNRNHPDPFYLHFCNAGKSSNTMQQLNRRIPTIYDPAYPLTINSESYLNAFPKEKLIYLTPHGNEVMTKYDHNAIYIIAALVDLGGSEPLTLAKAKREGIRMQKLPIDRYLQWGLGQKSLPINQILSIMLDMKHTDDWNYSMRHIAKRKLKSYQGSPSQLKNDLRKRYLKSNRYQHNQSSYYRGED